MWQESYDKIKTIAPDTKFIQRLDVFNVIEPNYLTEPNDLSESIEEWSQEMLQLFKVQSHHEKISVKAVLHKLFHQNKFMRSLALNCTKYITYRTVRD